MIMGCGRRLQAACSGTSATAEQGSEGMNKRVLACVLGCGVAAGAACSRVQAEARQVDAFQWEGVERVVAIGDLHGDYENYLATLCAAGLIDRKDKSYNFV